MKYVILIANSEKYDHYKWLRKEKKIIWSFSKYFHIQNDDIVLLYSTKNKEIKFLLNSELILKNSNKNEILEKMGEKELSKYKNKNFENKTSLFNMKLIKELDLPIKLNEIRNKKIPEVLFYIEEERDSDLFKKITDLIL
ncbi:MAG: hypothetical protein HPAVJP_2910 [Candidatus Hepatoplasma vulgare]|nr:MAG: hypothetical protein HPAVJP_2910 [Candidatus Hepatoplasma sp.]